MRGADTMDIGVDEPDLVGQPGPDELVGAGPVGLGAGRSAAGPPRLAGDRQNPARLVHGRVAVDQFAGGTVDVIDAATHSGMLPRTKA